MVTARAPGRVVLIGDHTDYTGGLVLSMAIDRFTEVTGHPGGDRLRLRSHDDAEALDIALPTPDPRAVQPAWGRYCAAVAHEIAQHSSSAAAIGGFTGTVSTTVPIGAGLSSSAALEVATALALGADPEPLGLAQLCQRAEHRATGLPSGILDQLTSICGVEGHALRLDCNTLERTPVALSDRAQVQVRFVAHRRLVGSPYAERVAQCAAAEAIIGPLRLADAALLDRLEDTVVRRRARHVISENERVRAFAAALEHDDLGTAGSIMVDGHRSLRDDFDTSTAEMDRAVDDLCAVRGVYGARMTGGGFGGCVVALTEPGVHIPGAWVVRAAAGAAVVEP